MFLLPCLHDMMFLEDLQGERPRIIVVNLDLQNKRIEHNDAASIVKEYYEHICLLVRNKESVKLQPLPMTKNRQCEVILAAIT